MAVWEEKFIDANGIRIHYLTAGNGPPVVLLHGFPESSYAWRHQIPALANHFRVITPDLRGYGQTDKPPNISNYKMSTLVADTIGLIHALGYDKTHIIGHDWGGAIAWNIALNEPHVIDHLAVLNCSHPQKMARALRSNYRQMLRSWYIFFFQLPYLPEFLIKINLRHLLEDIFTGSIIRKDAINDEVLDVYQKNLQKPEAISSALNYYRAALRYPNRESKLKKITVPTLLIWGENDTALGKELTYDMESLFSGPFQLKYIPNCSHWVNEEQPEIVNQLLLDFLTDKMK